MSEKLKNLMARVSGEEPPMVVEGLAQVTIPTIQVSVAELKEVIRNAQPGCEIAASFTKGIQGFRDDYKLIVEKPDLEACLSGKCCEIREEIVMGRMVRTKVVVDHKAAPAPKPTPKPEPEKK